MINNILHSNTNSIQPSVAIDAEHIHENTNCYALSYIQCSKAFSLAKAYSVTSYKAAIIDRLVARQTE